MNLLIEMQLLNKINKIEEKQGYGMGRALSRKAMYDMKFDYRSYSFPSDDGQFTGTLDMKEWGKSPCLHCYFTTDDGRKIYLIAYFEKAYHPNKSSINFSSRDVKLGDKFLLTVRKSKNEKLRWEDASCISNHD